MGRQGKGKGEGKEEGKRKEGGSKLEETMEEGLGREGEFSGRPTPRTVFVSWVWEGKKFMLWLLMVARRGKIRIFFPSPPEGEKLMFAEFFPLVARRGKNHFVCCKSDVFCETLCKNQGML